MSKPRKPLGKRRTGHTRVPNNIWNDTNLSLDDIAILTYFDSHNLNFQFNREKSFSVLGIGEQKYDKHVGRLRKLGYLDLVNFHKNGSIAGQYGSVNWTPKSQSLHPEIQCSENPTAPRNSMHGKSGRLRSLRDKKTHPDSDVIDNGDIESHQDQNSAPHIPDQFYEADVLLFAENNKP